MVHEAGDHWIVVARVLELMAAAERSPLIAFRGEYGTFLRVPTA